MNVHILATCLAAERLKATLLVFRTIRVGFPDAKLFVYGNELDSVSSYAVWNAAAKVDGQFKEIKHRSHGEWIEQLLATENEPFWICDTDVIFFDRVKSPTNGLFAGRFEPEFNEPWTRSLHVARLHPSLMWFNPVSLRAAMRAWPGRHIMLNSVQMNLIQWNWVPKDGQLIFYDTCAGLHHVFGGTQFTDDENARFAHLYCGTYAHLCGMPTHDDVYDNMELARGLWAKQQEWLLTKSPNQRIEREQ